MLAWHLWAMAAAVVASSPVFLLNLTGSLAPGTAVGFAVLLAVCLAGLTWSLVDATRTRRAADRAAGEGEA